MSLARVFSLVDGIMTPAQGDLLDLRESIASSSTVGNSTIAAAAIAQGTLNRTGPTGDYSDTLAPLETIIAALSTSASLLPTNVTFESIYQPSGRPSAGSTFRFLYRNTVAFIMTMVTNTGITLIAPTTVAASSVREYLFTLTNTTRITTLLGTMTNTSNTLIGLDATQLDGVSIGQNITAASGIGGGMLVAGVNKLAGTVTMSGTATATQTVPITFNPTARVAGLWQADI